MTESEHVICFFFLIFAIQMDMLEHKVLHEGYM